MGVSTDLSGVWGFRADPCEEGIWKRFFEEKPTEEILLPGTMACRGKGGPCVPGQTEHLTEVYPFEGGAWYYKTVELPKKSKLDMFQLLLERTRRSSVWVNGRFVSSADSFCAPHRYDLTEFLKAGPNRLAILVRNTGYRTKGGHMTSPDTQTNWNGILGELSLTRYTGVRIGDFQLYPHAKQGRLEVSFSVICAKGVPAGDARADLSLEPPAGEAPICWQEPIALQEGEHSFRLSFPFPADGSPLCWNEYAPNLYRAVLRVETAGFSDTKAAVIGFRDLHTDGRDFYLTDLPVLLRGKHDGMVYPLTGHAPMDKAAWIRTFETAKEYGINHYRFHTCCPPEAAFCAADEMGVYLEPELPFWGSMAAEGEEGYDRVEREFLVEEGRRILKAFGSHPSFLLFSLGNELWGSRSVLSEILRSYRALDPRHFYTQGSNTFQFSPEILPEDDFFCGVRLAKDRLLRGSYAMCDAPQGHVQTDEPAFCHIYDAAVCPEGKRPEVPVVTHEIGQYAMYPDFSEIGKYTGVLRADYLDVFRERLQKQGLLGMADRFFRSSGLLAADCYKRELEAAFASRELAGFQILDLQDFPGQGIALVGILNAFLENKGLISPGQWRRFCSDRVLLLRFARHVYRTKERFSYEILFVNMRPVPLQDARVRVSIRTDTGQETTGEERFLGTLDPSRLLHLGTGELPLPDSNRPQVLTVRVSLVGTDVENEYELYVYPPVSEADPLSDRAESPGDIVITDRTQEMLRALEDGKRVLFFGGRLRPKRRIEGTYCTDFWCYPMFSSISKSMGKPEPVGTMGLCLNPAHPAFRLFPTADHTSPAWWNIVTGAPLAILDDLPVTPIVWMIDNPARCHRIGLLYEAAVGAGRLLVCQADLRQKDSPEQRWLYRSLTAYLESEAFAPQERLTPEQLLQLYEEEEASGKKEASGKIGG